MDVEAPLIAKKAEAGQFVIVRVDERGERIPLTLVDWDKDRGVITLVYQAVGLTTRKLSEKKEGEHILDVVGPLGNPGAAEKFGTVAVIGGGVGVAAAYPRAKQLRQKGNYVISIIGARSSNLLIFEDEMRSVSDELYISTDDGTKGRKGFVSDVLRDLLQGGRKIDYVFAVGPTVMMRAVAKVTKEYRVKTDVSLNPIMVDGTGMCGACRVRVGGETKFTCVDGPEFDGHQVDFEELLTRLNTYREEEAMALERYVKRGGGED
ncbi:sulfide/dihydroorotate dehydrogenase-like FAD/NAD-binding protein [Candidatus Bathyarchaeota archaeon]|nr:MAG: sulfide/dihydroorotate dehydrogenase-like FAD/NAD-binding protein [Candidatus Bathyarchaeota archaeon]